jgi:hypothetical protein
VCGAGIAKCTSYGDCGSCLDDPSGVCGWCDGIVTDLSGNVICGQDGNGCCGGSDGFSQCNVNYRKICPVLCGEDRARRVRINPLLGKFIAVASIYFFIFFRALFAYLC